MLRQNRYKYQDFILDTGLRTHNEDEILISEIHDIVIALEPDQVQNFETLKPLITEIIKAVPKLDNET